MIHEKNRKCDLSRCRHSTGENLELINLIMSLLGLSISTFAEKKEFHLCLCKVIVLVFIRVVSSRNLKLFFCLQKNCCCFDMNGFQRQRAWMGMRRSWNWQKLLTELWKMYTKPNASSMVKEFCVVYTLRWHLTTHISVRFSVTCWKAYLLLDQLYN